MRKLFVIMGAVAIGLAGLASNASANALTAVLTGPANIAVGGTTTFIIVMQLDPDVSGATAQVDVLGGAEIVAGTNNMAGTALATSNFALRSLTFIAEGPACSVASGVTTCTNPAGSPSAGNVGGLGAAAGNPGTYTIGSYTVQGFSVGTTTVAFRIRPGVNEWTDGAGTNLAATQPTLTGFQITVIPEPATASLIGLGLVGLVLMGRRSRS